MTTSHVLFEQNGPIAIITINRPEARNAMTWEMYQALVEFCGTVDVNDNIRTLILRGSGGQAFIAGTDISQFQSFSTSQDALEYERRIDCVINTIEQVSKPTIAQIEGVATGGGFVIAAACDLRFCTPESRFGIPISRTLGNCLSADSHARCLDLIGPARLKELIYTGRLINGAEAMSAGLVNQVIAQNKIENTVLEIADTISSNAPLTIKATKTITRSLLSKRRVPSSEANDIIVTCYTSSDFKEGVAAFLEKRRPHWTGS